MIVGISEDFSYAEVVLDSQLKAVPTSGIFLNTGVHPSITVENLLYFLPKTTFTFSAWNSVTPYTAFLTSRNRTDIVTKNSKLFESIKAGTNQDPEEADSEYWVETNIESLRLKLFIQSVMDKVLADLNLNKRLVNNQYLYENGDQPHTLPNDYAAWCFEPKGSDYVDIRINELSLQKSGTTPVNVYIVHEGVLLSTIQVTPANGQNSFQEVGVVLSGKGRFYIAIDSTEVYKGIAHVDPLKYDGFVAYTVTGTGDAPETADYSYQTSGIGLGVNVTAYLNANKYVTHNLQDFGAFVRAAFEYMAFTMFHSNPNNRSNRAERLQLPEEVLLAELKRMDGDTVAKRYYVEKKRAIARLEKTFDTQLSDNKKLKVKVGSV